MNGIRLMIPFPALISVHPGSCDGLYGGWSWEHKGVSPYSLKHQEGGVL